MAELERVLAGFGNLGVNFAGVFVFWLVVGLVAWPYQAWSDRRRRAAVRRLVSPAQDDA